MISIVHRAAALADDTRIHLLQELVDGEATVSDLGARLMLPQPRVSTHLKILLDAGLVAVETAGRQRSYRVEVPWIQRILTTLGATEVALRQLSPPSKQAAREVQRNSAIRQARTCYGHLAGVTGVQLLEELLTRKWLTGRQEGGRPHYELTSAGLHALSRRSVDLESATAERRVFAYGCPDWTERRPHLAGALGTAVFRALKEAGIVRRSSTSRIVTLLRPVTEWLNSPEEKEQHRPRYHAPRRVA